MTSIDAIRELLHAVAGVLVWPVLLSLLALMAAMIYALGAFAREAWDRRAKRLWVRGKTFADLARACEPSPDEALDLRLEHVLQESERRRWASLAKLRLVVRLGPALGLMGTLIPMAFALQGLADGNLPALATNLVTAFAATVIGLACSVVAYLLAAVRESWVREDSQALNFHAERLLRQHSAAGL